MLTEKTGFVPGWWQELPGAGWRENMHFPALEPRTSQGPTPTPRPPPQRAVQSNHQFIGEMAIKGQLQTKQFLKAQKHFSWSWTFFECFFQVWKQWLFVQTEAASRINSGTWVLGVTGVHHGFLSLILKASCFYSWVNTDICWPAPLVDRGWPASLPAQIGSDKQRALLMPGLAFWVEVSQGADRRRQKHNWPQTAWVLRDCSPSPFAETSLSWILN